MEQRRFVQFIILAMMIFIGWYGLVLPRLMPPVQKQDVADAGGPDADGDGKLDAKKDDAKKGDDEKDGGPGVVKPAPGDPVAGGDDPAPAPGDDPGDDPADDEPEIPRHPAEIVRIGSLDPESGYFMEAVVNSAGAAIESISLNDPRYRELIDADAALKIVGNSPSPSELRKRLNAAKLDGFVDVARTRKEPEPNEQRVILELPDETGWVFAEFDHELGEAERERFEERIAAALARTPRTFALAVPADDEAFAERDEPGFAKRNWELVKTEEDVNGVVHDATFALRSVDGALEVRKRYWLERLDPSEVDLDDARSGRADGYVLRFSVTLENVGEEAITPSYTLQGPVGVPLEDADNARKYRDLKGAFGDGGGEAHVPASTVVSQVEDNDLKQWTKPVKYVGVDVQFFAALVLPRGDQAADPYLRHVEAQLVEKNRTEKFSDISLLLVSRTLDLAPGDAVTHEYDLFAGPKKKAVLETIGAVDVIDYGWFPFGRGLTKLISNALLGVLNFLYWIGLPYGLAIIGLTIIVRGAMFPISLKQHRNMATMRELQPKIKELQKKYENDKDKMGRALMQLYAEHNYNPIAGCLPMLLQMPIFIGLYQALGNAVELRMSRFLWADNLAGPDSLFEMPFSLPFLGSSFNLLPILTIVLFIVQQKMFMPEPADEQQAAQQKMMKYMMVFIGFLFYHVPAGLCIYLIASSLWGLGERQMLGQLEGPKSPSGEGTGDESDRDSGGRDSSGGKGGGGKGGGGKGGDSDNGNGGGGGSFLSRLLEKADAAGNQTAGSGSTSSGGSGGGNSGGGRTRKSRKDKGNRRKSRR